MSTSQQLPEAPLATQNTLTLIDPYANDGATGATCNYLNLQAPNASWHIVGTQKDDIILAGLTADVLEGRAGSDRIYGGGGKDRIYGDATLEVAAAVEAAKQTQTGSTIGNILDGGGADDFVIGGTSSQRGQRHLVF